MENLSIHFPYDSQMVGSVNLGEYDGVVRKLRNGTKEANIWHGNRLVGRVSAADMDTVRMRIREIVSEDKATSRLTLALRKTATFIESSPLAGGRLLAAAELAEEGVEDPTFAVFVMDVLRTGDAQKVAQDLGLLDE